MNIVKKSWLLILRGVVLIACLVFFILSFYRFGFIHIFDKPVETDSVVYHIPIAKSYLNGTIFHPDYPAKTSTYYPSSSEGILAVFILLGLPMNAYNIVAIGLLLWVAWRLAQQLRFNSILSILYAVSIAGGHGVIRYANIQTVDIWLGIYVIALTSLLIKNKWTVLSCLLFGFLFGMIMGTKYSGILYAPGIFIVSFFYLPKGISINKLGVAALSAFIFGGVWYLRNYLVWGNPLYPFQFLWFNSAPLAILDIPVWRILIFHPLNIINALINEFGIWGFAYPILLMYSITRFSFRIKVDTVVHLLSILILLFSFIYIFHPCGFDFVASLSSMRYIYPAVMLSITLLFYLLSNTQYAYLLYGGTLTNTILLHISPYRPKIVTLFALSIFVCLILLKIFNKNKIGDNA